MNHIKRIALIIGICFVFMAIYKYYQEMMPIYDYILTALAEVNGRQVAVYDGDANLQEPDHIYRMNISTLAQEVTAIEECTFNDVTMQGEIERLSFDHSTEQFLLYNRGAKIVNGIPTGFYDGYEHEIHEIFVYELLWDC